MNNSVKDLHLYYILVITAPPDPSTVPRLRSGSAWGLLGAGALKDPSQSLPVRFIKT